jgi:hypothetical protein
VRAIQRPGTEGQPAEVEDLIITVEGHKTAIATVKAGYLDLSTRTGQLVVRMRGANRTRALTWTADCRHEGVLPGSERQP